MKKGIVLIILLVAVIIIAIAAVYFTFFFTRECKDKGCFDSALGKCKRVWFLDDVQDATWVYTINGKSGNQCEVYVELKKLKQGKVELLSLEGEGMTCSLPLGSVSSPQGNLIRCHGLLKEEMQNVIITRLHNYILSNLGKLSEELEKPL